MEDKELRRDIVDALRGMSLDGQRVADAFAHSNGLNATDMRALVLIMEAEMRHEALTAGQLSARLGTSSGATTAVIDRLERIGHIHRNRSHADRRKVTLHFEPLAMQLAGAYFGPLGALTDEVMSRYTDTELRTILGFMQAIRDAYDRHINDRQSDGAAAPVTGGAPNGLQPPSARNG
ncbi:MarR family winged helix-turn-helix transcriptional regulator [Arthrobacter sp. zg-Y1171]|uniref:MarR family winged helix-turn-helix transcriptional regulator n=1 Tax=Arthrobacter sp. zg-Y1171 TaxID=2964610 RepID=UPI0021031C14|nr:MarR family transcriptional regulator [Arthrobacter sp. zg-Y1171]MCQ1996781.1 MarR family transcriptional regulator [Arthrobacter sp. zg-Y1171]UWX82375.1 MarR family transcriptional regulator [Arthrobacter sp. zg-Y1171]